MQKRTISAITLVLIVFTLFLLHPVMLGAEENNPEAVTEQSGSAPEKDAKPEEAPAMDMNASVANVNGVAILRQELENEMEVAIRRTMRQGRQVPPDQLPAMREQVLESLIGREVLWQEIKNNTEITADETKVEEQYAEIEKNFDTKEEFTQELEKRGFTEASLKTQIRRGMAINEYLTTEVINKIEISDEDTRKFYDENPQFFSQPEQIRARHILIKVAPDADEAAKQEAMNKLKEVSGKLGNGEPFEELAKAYSEGPSSENGGDLGFFGKGQMVKPFEDAAFALEPGQVSEPVETRFGYHLIKLEEKKPASTQEYEAVKGQIENALNRQKATEAINQHVMGLKEKAAIERSLAK